MERDGLIGIYRGTGRGYGFFIPEDGSGDWFIPPGKEGGAWDGDKVRLSPAPEDDGEGRRQAGAVEAVLERANKRVTGMVRREGRKLWLEPDNKRLPGPILLLDSRRRAGQGELAAAAVLSFGGRGEPPMGRLRQTFGRAGGRAAAVEALLYQHEIQTAFPPDALAEADAVPAQVPPEAMAGRLDLREELVITIDGADAKDLDDAVSLKRDGEGRWVLGVHIADVSHYVAAHSALDREAFERGASVYFADRVIPMLPPALSNGICSLNPRVDRLTLSCVMTLDHSGAVVDHKLAKSVIRTAERMTYSDCNALLAGSDPLLAEQYAHILPMLTDMAALAEKLARRRRARGSLDLESGEAAILCDGQGSPIAVELRRPGRAEGLIEEFMLRANETVAAHLHRLRKPCVHRVHERPLSAKTETLRAALAPLGLELRQSDHFSLQRVLEATRDKPEGPMVSALVLRAMMKARYSEEDLGHFGLAAPHYCHFTSPIRRYPDLMVHRILTALLEGRLHGGTERRLRAAAQSAAVQSSRRELAIQSAEREIEKRYMAEFMLSHIGEAFPAAVSGASRAGLFVLLPFGVEGVVPTETLPGEGYQLDETTLTLTGPAGRFSLGTPLEVVCTAADPGAGRVEFRLKDSPPRRTPQPSPAPLPNPPQKGGKRPPAPRKRRGRR